MKMFTSLLFTLLISLLSVGQIATEYPCYAIAKNNGNSNVLYGYSPDDANWFRISSTQTNNIAALAVDNDKKILYAFESNVDEAEGKFGIIDSATRNFDAIGSPGIASGSYGDVMLNNVTGLAFDSANNIMYAVHRISGNINQTNDLLFQIDLSTGNFVPGAMTDSDGFPADYSIIEEALDTDNNVLVYNVSDIAINPGTDELYAVYTQDNSNSIIEVIDWNGASENTVYELSLDNIESLSFTSNGDLYATTGNIGGSANSFLNINYNNQSTTTLAYISRTDIDFESLECFHKTVDFGTCDGVEIILANAVQPGLHQSLSVKDNVNTENYIEENSTVILAAKEEITFENMFIPSNSNLVMEIRPCGI